MKKLVVAGLILALLVPSLHARKKKEKAGTVKDQVYIDKKYGFSFHINKGWKYKIKGAKENFRLVLTQKNYEIPPDYIDAREYTKVPRIVTYADTSSMGAMQFLDSLLSKTYSSDQKKEIIKEFEILNEQALEESTEREETVTRKRRAIKIAGASAALWEGQSIYWKYISTSASAIGGTRIRGAYGGGVMVTKKGNTIVLFHVICEWAYFNTIMRETLTMTNTLNWETTGEEKAVPEK